MRRPFLILGAARFASAALIGALASDAASSAPNRAPPDFARSSGWVADGNFDPPKSGPGPIANDPAHPFITNARSRETGEQPTFRVADLSNPILLPRTRETLRQINDRVLSGEAVFGARERCWPLGVPGWLLYSVNPIYFLQTSEKIVMIWAEDPRVRHVYLNAQHSTTPKPSWFGESVGHYEGDNTLVVDTIGLSDRTSIDSFGTPHTAELHVIERYRLVDGGMAIRVDVHVEDRGAFTVPWNAVQNYRRVTQGPLIEQPCGENTLLFGNTDPIPQDESPDF